MGSKNVASVSLKCPAIKSASMFESALIVFGRIDRTSRDVAPMAMKSSVSA